MENKFTQFLSTLGYGSPVRTLITNRRVVTVSGPFHDYGKKEKDSGLDDVTKTGGIPGRRSSNRTRVKTASYK